MGNPIKRRKVNAITKKYKKDYEVDKHSIKKMVNKKTSIKDDLEDALLASTVSFAKAVSENESIEEDLLIKQIAYFTLDSFKNSRLIFSNPEGVTKQLKEKIEPLLLSTKISQSIMLGILISYLIDILENNLAVKMFSKIKTDVDRFNLTISSDKDYKYMYMKQLSLIEDMFGKTLSYKEKIVIKKLKVAGIDKHMDKESFDSVLEEFAKAKKYSLLIDLDIDTKELLLALVFNKLFPNKKELDKAKVSVSPFLLKLDHGIKRMAFEATERLNGSSEYYAKDLQHLINMPEPEIVTLSEYFLEDTIENTSTIEEAIEFMRTKIKNFLNTKGSTLPYEYIYINSAKIREALNLLEEDFVKILSKNKVLKRIKNGQASKNK